MTIDPIKLKTWKEYYQCLLSEDRPQFDKVNYHIEKSVLDLVTLATVKGT